MIRDGRLERSIMCFTVAKGPSRAKAESRAQSVSASDPNQPAVQVEKHRDSWEVWMFSSP